MSGRCVPLCVDQPAPKTSDLATTSLPSDSPFVRKMHHRNQTARCGQTRRCHSRRDGFTLLELLLVLAILVVVGGIAVRNFVGAGNDAKNDATRVQMNEIKTAITQYQIRFNSLPEQLETLRDGPSDADKKARWSDPIFREIPKDAWENEFVYSVNGNTYELRSAGLDGQTSTDDDIVEEGP